MDSKHQPIPAGRVERCLFLFLAVGMLNCDGSHVAVEAGTESEAGAGLGRTEAGLVPDGSGLSVDDARRLGTDGVDEGTPLGGSIADALELRDLAQVADQRSSDGMAERPGADTPEQRDLAQEGDGRASADGAPPQDTATDAPTTTLPPVPCQGTCGAVCTGTCIGKACLVTTVDGRCASSCDGWCDGTCSGSCTPLGHPCVVQGTAVPDGQNCPSSSLAQYLCQSGTCIPIQPAGSCVLPAGQTYKDGDYERSFIVPGEHCPAGGTCRDGTCCSGCWDGSACLPGDTLTACGGGGGPCQHCVWTCTTLTGPVNNPCGGAYGMDSIIAYQPTCEKAAGCKTAPVSAPTCCGLSGNVSCSPEAGCQ